MAKRTFLGLSLALVLLTGSGCELTASMYVQQEYNTDPRVFSKPDGLAKAEIKITKLIGKDAKKK